MSLDYGWEKFFRAVSGAAASGSSLQRRLADAYAYNIIQLRQDDVPAESWERIQKLAESVTRQPAKGDEGTINATTAMMSDKEAGKWLEEIVSIFNEVAEAYYTRQAEKR